MNPSAHPTQFPLSDGGRRRSVPAWAMSLAAHLLMILSLVVLWKAPDAVVRDEPDRSGGIVLVEPHADRPASYYEDSHESQSEETDRPAAANSLSAEVPTADVLPALPDASDSPALRQGEITLPEVRDLPSGLAGVVQSPTLTPGGRPRLPGGTDVAAVLAADAARLAALEPRGTPTQVSLFGSPAAVGRSFVFLIDRSNSMGGDGLNALAAAEQHLLSALDNLGDDHQFQIVVYNERPFYFQERQLLDASEENKELAASYLATLSARGKTDHDLALHSVLRMQPDVIFLLSDGGTPELTAPQQRTIQRLTGNRTAIHCIQFGFGPLQDNYSFLHRLADINRGSFTYVDMREQH